MPEKGDPEDLPEVLYLEHSSKPQASTHTTVSRLAPLLCLYVATCVLCFQAPWGIISVKAQDEDFETPMQPITIMRNSLVSVCTCADDVC